MNKELVYIKNFIEENTQHLSDNDFSVSTWIMTSQGTGSTIESHIRNKSTEFFYWNDIKDYIIPLVDVLCDDNVDFNITIRFNLISDCLGATMIVIITSSQIIDDNLEFGLPISGLYYFDRKKISSAVLNLNKGLSFTREVTTSAL